MGLNSVAAPVAAPHSATTSAPAPRASAGDYVVCGANNHPVVNLHNVSFGVGNITVCNHASLTFEYGVISILSVTTVGNSWWAGNLNERYHVNVTNGAQLHFIHAVLNTSAASPDADPFLNVTVSQSSILSLDSSNLSFSGSVYVTGQSLLFLNRSNVQPNTAMPNPASAPASLVADSAYAPTITVNSLSSLVTAGSTIQNYYKNPASSTPALDENFSKDYSAAAPLLTNLTLYASWTPQDPNQLVGDVYDQWTAATLEVFLNSPTTATATVNFTAYGLHSSPVTLNIVPGLAAYYLPISAGFVQAPMSSNGLAGLLGQMQLGSAGFAVTSISYGGVVALEGMNLSLVPYHDYNVTIRNHSHFFGVDTRLDVNYANASAGCGNTPDQSNKVIFSDGSWGDLANTTPYTLFSNGKTCSGVDAFQVDSLVTPASFYWVYYWAGFSAVGPTGTADPGVELDAYSPVDSNATYQSNPAHMSALYYAALASRSLPVGAPLSQYANTSLAGTTEVALAGAYVTHATLGPGLPVTTYVGSFTQDVVTINGTSTPASVGGTVTISDGACNWPYANLGCGAMSLPKVQLPITTADLQMGPISVNAAYGTCTGTGCQVYEGVALSVSITIIDTNWYEIAGGATVPVYLYDVYGSSNDSAPIIAGDPATISDASFSAGNNDATVQFQLTVPFHVPTSPVPHLWAAIDPHHVAPSNGTNDKNGTFQYTALPAPTLGTLTIQAIDGCLKTPLNLPGSAQNSCNTVIFETTLTNSGDAPVGVNSVFKWGATAPTTQIGGIQYDYLNPGESALVNVTMPVTYLTTSGYVFLTVTSPSGAGGPPPINLFAQSSQFVLNDYTSLAEHSFSASIVVPGGPGPTSASLNKTIFRVGDAMGFTLGLANYGKAALANATLSIQNPSGLGWEVVGNYSNISVPAATVGTGIGWLNVSGYWHINAKVIGTTLGLHRFQIALNWSNVWLYGLKTLNYSYTYNATIGAPQVTIPGFGFTPQTMDLGAVRSLSIAGHVYYETYNGSPTATISTLLIDPQSGLVCEAYAGTTASNGSAIPAINPGDPAGSLSGCLTAGTYNLQVKVSYLGATWFFNVSSALTLNSVVVTQSFVGSLLFWLIIIVVVVVAAVLGFLFYMKKFGKGNLVECGECGELIPESAVACPHCGAEFEKNLVRCSRCGSSIPAVSTVCPECSVLLVGKEADPSAEAYGKFSERYRVQARKELGDNYNESSFWEWWRRQPTYIPFATWKQQQQPAAKGQAPQTMMSQGDNMPAGGMGRSPPPSGGAGGPVGPGGYPDHQAASADEEASAQQPGTMKVCPSCGKGINESFLLCPFCGAVTR